MAEPGPARAGGPRVSEAAEDDRGHEAEHARPRAGPALHEAIDDGGRRRHQPGGPGLEERDQGQRNVARVDVDVAAHVDARDHQDHRDGAEGQPVGDHTQHVAASRMEGEPLRAVGVEEDADRADPGGLEEMVQVDCYSTSTTISISTGMPTGSSAMPTAERACLPMASPNTSTIRSENPLMTLG